MKTYSDKVVFLLFSCPLFLLITCSSNNNPSLELTTNEKVSLLISRTLQQTGTLVPRSELNKAFLKKHFIPPELQQEFIRTYEAVRGESDIVLEEYKTGSMILGFLLLKHSCSRLNSGSDARSAANLAVSGNPVFMAFSLIMEEMPDFRNIDNVLYIKQLVKSFGVAKEEDIINGIWCYLQNSELDICRSVAVMINDNVQDERSKKPDFFFQNICIPFLIYTSKGLVLRASIEELIFERFLEAFFKPGRKPSVNVLKDFTIAFRNFLLGGTLNIRYQHALNTILMGHGYRIYVREKTCIGYKILDYTIPIRKSDIGDVVFLNKVSISLSMNYLGFSMLAEKDVVLTMDNFTESGDDVVYIIKNEKPVFSYSNRKIGKYWNNFNVGFDVAEADRIYAKLVKKEFKGQSQKTILNRIIRYVAMHEVKHKWDEKQEEAQAWYNVDSETSAHITEILYGGTPYYSLLGFINRYHDYYTDIEVEEVREKILPILVTCWQLASQAADGSITVDEIKKRLRSMYDEYKLLSKEGKLPDMDVYAKEIVEPCFQFTQELDPEKIRVSSF